MTLIDKGEGFAFGFSKLELMFGRARMDEVVAPYAEIAKPGVRVLRETVTAIDPEALRVSTDAGIHEGDALVIALGADYDMDATPGLAEGGHEFYSFAGAERLAPVLTEFSRGHAVIGVCGAPFKCPPAPSECALMLDDELRARGVRDRCRISFVVPLRRSGAALAGDLGRAGSGVRRAWDRAGRRPPGGGARPGAAASPCSTTRASCPSTSSSACPSTAPPRW